MVDFKHEPQSAIDAHGIIGDMRSAALVNDKGSVDFFCWPEFDSPSIFCALLDTPDAGIFGLSETVSMGQWLSLPMVVVGVIMLVVATRRTP